MKKIKFLLILPILFALSSCDLIGINGTAQQTGGNNSGQVCDGGNCATGTVNIDAINQYFASDGTEINGEILGVGGKAALIPFVHINGPKAEWEFFAIVNFQYHFSKYSRYQITYLSCTCRDAQVNYWQTMYLELSTPKSRNLNDVEIKSISFEKDGSGDYLAGFWGDSGMDFDSADNMRGVTYEEIRDVFIPFLIGKTYSDIKDVQVTKTSYNEAGTKLFYGFDDNEFAQWAINNDKTMKGSPATLTAFVGASVSTNNIIRVVQSAMKYHASLFN